MQKGANPFGMVVGNASDPMYELVRNAREAADSYQGAGLKRASSQEELQDAPAANRQHTGQDMVGVDPLQIPPASLGGSEQHWLFEIDAEPPVSPQAPVLNDQGASGKFPPDPDSDSDLSPEAEQALNAELDKCFKEAAGPADAEILQSLGYDQEQIKEIKAENYSEVIKHHQTLFNQGYTWFQIVKVSKRAQSLSFLAEKGRSLFLELPSLTKDHIVSLASSRYGELSLAALLKMKEDLHNDHRRLNESSLRFNTNQLVKIAQMGGRAVLEQVHLLRNKLSSEPYNLTSEQVVDIASNVGGAQALEAKYLSHL